MLDFMRTRGTARHGMARRAEAAGGKTGAAIGKGAAAAAGAEAGGDRGSGRATKTGVESAGGAVAVAVAVAVAGVRAGAVAGAGIGAVTGTAGKGAIVADFCVRRKGVSRHLVGRIDETPLAARISWWLVWQSRTYATSLVRSAGNLRAAVCLGGSTWLRLDTAPLRSVCWSALEVHVVCLSVPLIHGSRSWGLSFANRISEGTFSLTVYVAAWRRLSRDRFCRHEGNALCAAEDITSQLFPF